MPGPVPERGGLTSLRRLSLEALPGLAPEHRPRIDPRSLRVAIVHLGLGAFHRAHQAAFTEDAVAAAGGDWGICGVSQRSPGVVEQLGPQDGLYAIAVRDADRETVRVVGTVRRLRWARGEPRGLLEELAAPRTRVVTLTVTEKGYHRDAATGRLRLDDPEIAADLARATTSTVIAQLAYGLQCRRAGSAAPVTVVSCDNLPANGRTLRGLVADFAARLPDGDGLVGWIDEHVRFPNTMVDRIVPATTDEDRVRTAAVLGVRDEGVVVTEPFRQWVIEDDFAAGRPAWERAGAVLTDDVAPYEAIKLRLLNGSHSAIAYLGALAGHELIADALPAFDGLLRGLMARDAAPTLSVPAGVDLPAYQDEVLHRFANPAVRYRTLQVAADGSQKLPQRLLATIADRRRAGSEPVAASLAVAAWMRFVSARVTDDGRPLPLDDPLADELTATVRGAKDPGAVVDRLLTVEAIFDPSLAGDRAWRDLLVEQLTALHRDGAARTADRLGG